jgi:hypothetical protein
LAADVHFVPVTSAHVLELAQQMRAADVAECAALGLTPMRAVVDSIVESERGGWCAAVLFDGKLACCLGTAPLKHSLLGGTSKSIFWLLTSKVVDQHKLTFWRAGRKILKPLRALFGEFHQVVDARHTQALGAARSLGFQVLDPVAVGPAGLPFHPIVLR